MSESKRTNYSSPLFEAWSTYGRLRRHQPGDKLRGYFLELSARGEEGWVPPVQRSREEEGWVPPVKRVRPAAGSPEMFVLARNARHLAGVLGLHRFRRGQEKFRVTGSGLEPPEGGAAVPCRLFVIDPAIRLLLEELVRGGCERATLEAAFDPEHLRANAALARVLSDVPDVDGEIAADGQLHLPVVELPSACYAARDLPQGAALVLVADMEVPQ